MFPLGLAGFDQLRVMKRVETTTAAKSKGGLGPSRNSLKRTRFSPARGRVDEFSLRDLNWEEEEEEAGNQTEM